MAQIMYCDTRESLEKPRRFTEAVVEGMAAGGGLFVPERIPQLSQEEIIALADMPYAKQAAFVYKSFAPDVDPADIDDLMQAAYGDNFDCPEVAPVYTLNEDTFILELWHGPTSAFKDMALQCLPLFFSHSAQTLRKEGGLDAEHLILVATSGDTGKAALEGFKDKEGIRIGVLYPEGGVSDIQFKQMATQEGNNVTVWAVEGNFDDCQGALKTIFTDEDFAQDLAQNHHVALSSANSINWGRLLPQVVYYLSAYARLVSKGSIAPDASLDVCVPTGNFGNILAAYYAKQMGAKIGLLLCASNENCVLTDFINTGTYDISERPFVLTPSPSMDILVSSNLERQLFELTGRDAGKICTWMHDLKTKKCFKVDRDCFAALRQQFSADWVDNDTCLSTIKKVYDQYNYLLDPHTAVAYAVAERLRSENPVLIASTAHWAKFGTSVYKALENLGSDEALPEDVSQLTGAKLNELVCRRIAPSVSAQVPVGLASLDEKPIRFSQTISSDADTIKCGVKNFLGQK